MVRHRKALPDPAPENPESWPAFQRAFAHDFARDVRLPVDGNVVGEPVEVVAVRYDGERQGRVTAVCRTRNAAYDVSLADVQFAAGSEAERRVSIYREWIGIPASTAPAPVRKPKAESAGVVPGQQLNLVALAHRGTALRCRVLGTAKELTLRSPDHWRVVPGEIAAVIVGKSWTHAGHPYVSGAVERIRLDAPALGLVPLRLEEQGSWDPAAYGWGPGEPVEEWARPHAERGPRPSFQMEQVVPSDDPSDFDSDPILEAVEAYEAGDRDARQILMNLLAADLRCLDAHAHLGNFAFDLEPDEALRHYQVGLRIGELSLPAGFEGVLPWGHIDNRPFLRCLHGVGLCLWRLGRSAEAAESFRRQLSLNPPDNQGARFLLEDLAAGRTWEKAKGADA